MEILERYSYVTFLEIRSRILILYVKLWYKVRQEKEDPTN